VTAPETPQVEIADPLALNVTVPVFPEPTVAVKVTVAPATRGVEGDAAKETDPSVFTNVKVVALLAAYQFASAALVTVIEHEPEEL
jgi:hypothetical protein